MSELRNAVLDVYAYLKELIDNGTVVDAFVTGARMTEDGLPEIDVDFRCHAAVREVNIEVNVGLMNERMETENRIKSAFHCPLI